MDEYQSAEAIQAQLEEIKQNQAALERALEARRQEDKQALIDEIRQMIQERGHDVGEIAEQIGGRGPRKKSRSGRAGLGNYVRYVDPDNSNNVYTRGRMPHWLTEKMTANGFDPADPAHRAQFKEQHLTKIAA